MNFMFYEVLGIIMNISTTYKFGVSTFFSVFLHVYVEVK